MTFNMISKIVCAHNGLVGGSSPFRPTNKYLILYSFPFPAAFVRRACGFGSAPANSGHSPPRLRRSHPESGSCLWRRMSCFREDGGGFPRKTSVQDARGRFETAWTETPAPDWRCLDEDEFGCVEVGAWMGAEDEAADLEIGHADEADRPAGDRLGSVDDGDPKLRQRGPSVAHEAMTGGGCCILPRNPPPKPTLLC